MTVNNATLTVAANANDSLMSILYPKIKPEQIIPLINPTLNSFNNFGANFSLIMVLLANPCTMIEDDCTPTFPPVAPIKGIKKAISGRK